MTRIRVIFFVCLFHRCFGTLLRRISKNKVASFLRVSRNNNVFSSEDFRPEKIEEVVNLAVVKKYAKIINATVASFFAEAVITPELYYEN